MSVKNNGDRKKRMISIELKQEIIKKHERGARVIELAKTYDRSTSTICTILKQKDAIKSATPAKGATILSQLRTNIHHEMEKLLLMWVKERVLAGDTVTEAVVCEKARCIFADLVKKEASSSKETSEEGFKASHGWFENFKKRAGICSVVRHGEVIVYLQSEEVEDLDNTSIQFDVEKLIISVRSRPQLWNKNDPGYGDKVLAEKLWDEIVEEDFNGTINKQKLKTRWHSLKELLRRELKTEVENPNHKKKSWVYYEHMLFLIPHVGFTSEDGTEYPFVSVKIEENPHEDTFTELPFNNSSEGNENEMENHSLSQATCQEPEFENFEKSHYSGDDYHFAMSIVPYMKQVPMHKKLKMRIAISEIILKEIEYP